MRSSKKPKVFFMAIINKSPLVVVKVFDGITGAVREVVLLRKSLFGNVFLYL